MRFKTSNLKEAKHTDLVAAVSWSSADDVISVGDDHKIFKWNLVSGRSLSIDRVTIINCSEKVSAETTKIGELSEDFHPTDMHWFPRGHQGGAGGGGKAPKGQQTDTYLITSAEGKLQLMGRNGRVEKSVEAHRGACLVGRWSHDGAGIVTGGEDGAVKIWYSLAE